MTATEQYEIVKDHPDVWGKVLAFCDYNDASYWASRVIRGDYSIQCSDSTSEAALLGLGVKWLASGGGTSLSYITAMIVNRKGEAAVEAWEERRGDVGVRRTNILAAVYAAIAEVKKEVPNG